MPVSDILAVYYTLRLNQTHMTALTLPKVKPGELPIYVVTNHSNTYGAASILYDKLLNAVVEKLDSFYLLPAFYPRNYHRTGNIWGTHQN